MNDIDFGYMVIKYNKKDGNDVERAYLEILNNGRVVSCRCKFFSFNFREDTYKDFWDSDENIMANSF